CLEQLGMIFQVEVKAAILVENLQFQLVYTLLMHVSHQLNGQRVAIAVQDLLQSSRAQKTLIGKGDLEHRRLPVVARQVQRADQGRKRIGRMVQAVDQGKL